RRNAEIERPPRRWLYREELHRVASAERVRARSVAAVLVASEHDRASFGTENVEVVPNGVDADAFAPELTARLSGAIVFSGTMSYPPNIRGARWFADECFPLVQQAVPGAMFVIAGAAPARELRELVKRPGIVVTGFVRSMPDTLNRANVAVAPMQSGAGIQNKILEAMACGLPLVTTTVDARDVSRRRLAQSAAACLGAAALALAGFFAATVPGHAASSAGLGVYRGAASPGEVGAFGTWLGRSPTYALDYFAGGTWAEIESPDWW